MLNFAVETLENRNAFANCFKRKKMRLVSVVKVSGVVGNLIGEIDELSLQRRTLIQ